MPIWLTYGLDWWAEASAFWKVFGFFGCWLVLWLPIALPLAMVLKWNPLQHSITIAQKLPLLASLYLLAPLLVYSAAALENLTLAEYGLIGIGEMLRSIATGLCCGVSGLVLLFVIERYLGWLTWQLSNSLQMTSLLASLLTTLVLALWISFTEELVFRGWLLTTLEQDYSVWIAASIASFIFAVLHLIWEGWSGLPQLPGLWLMGMILTLARSLDNGSLGLAIGLHAGWVWTIAYTDTIQFTQPSEASPAWLTGLGGKPLAGVMGILFLLGTGGVILSFKF